LLECAGVAVLVLGSVLVVLREYARFLEYPANTNCGRAKVDLLVVKAVPVPVTLAERYGGGGGVSSGRDSAGGWDEWDLGTDGRGKTVDGLASGATEGDWASKLAGGKREKGR